MSVFTIFLYDILDIFYTDLRIYRNIFGKGIQLLFMFCNSLYFSDHKWQPSGWSILYLVNSFCFKIVERNWFRQYLNLRGLTVVGLNELHAAEPLVPRLAIRVLKFLLRIHKSPYIYWFRQTWSKYKVGNDGLKSSNFFIQFLFPEQWKEPIASISPYIQTNLCVSFFVLYTFQTVAPISIKLAVTVGVLLRERFRYLQKLSIPEKFWTPINSVLLTPLKPFA
jgi:hypothetical protein